MTFKDKVTCCGSQYADRLDARLACEACCLEFLLPLCGPSQGLSVRVSDIQDNTKSVTRAFLGAPFMEADRDIVQAKV